MICVRIWLGFHANVPIETTKYKNSIRCVRAPLPRIKRWMSGYSCWQGPSLQSSFEHLILGFPDFAKFATVNHNSAPHPSQFQLTANLGRHIWAASHISTSVSLLSSFKLSHESSREGENSLKNNSHRQTAIVHALSFSDLELGSRWYFHNRATCDNTNCTVQCPT